MRWRRIWCGVLAALWLVLPVFAGDVPATRRIADLTGRTLDVAAVPQRVLSFASSATDVVIGLGLGTRLVGTDEYSGLLPGAEHVPVLCRGGVLSREAAALSKADLAFIWWYQDELAETLADAGVAVYRLAALKADGTPRLVRALGDCLAAPQTAEPMAEELERYLSGVSTTKVQGVRVYWEMYGAYKTSGAGSYADDLLRLAGGKNVAALCGSASVISPEALAQAQPDVVLFVEGFGTAAELKSRPVLAQSPAVRQGRVYGIPRLWLVAGPRLPQAVNEVRARLHRSP